MAKKQVKQPPAFGGLQSHNGFGEVGAQVEGLAACFRMGAGQGVRHGIGTILSFHRVSMDRPQTPQACLETFVESFVGSVSIAPPGGATAALGELDGVEGRDGPGLGQVGQVGMETDLLVAEGSDRLAVLLEIGDEEKSP